MQLLLLSSSKAGDSGYLTHALPFINQHLGEIKELLFIPYAGVSISYDDYTKTVQNALASLGINVTGIHQTEDPVAAVNNAQAIVIGGGNTFHLLHQLYANELISPIQEKVQAGTPYIGWSAGSNVAGMSIRTTNDMPIIEPPSFTALNLVPVQLNPHYTDYQPPGHHGETRQMRLEEFMVLNPDTPVIGIQEGTALKRDGNKLTLVGEKVGYLFKGGNKSEIMPQADLSEWL